MLNNTRGEFLKELIKKKQYKLHSKFIGECVQEYELNIITNNNNDKNDEQPDEDLYIDDLNNGVINMNTF